MVLIIVGGNSKIAFSLLNINRKSGKFKCVYLLSQRDIEVELESAESRSVKFIRYAGLSNMLQAIDNILACHSADKKVIVSSGTLSLSRRYSDKKILQNSVTSVLSASKVLGEDHLVKFIIVGSTLVFVPWLSRSRYKDTKLLEFRLFEMLSQISNNICYVACHPLAPASSHLGRFFSIPVDDVAYEIFEIAGLDVCPSKVIYTGGKLDRFVSRLFFAFSRVLDRL